MKSLSLSKDIIRQYCEALDSLRTGSTSAPVALPVLSAENPLHPLGEQITALQSHMLQQQDEAERLRLIITHISSRHLITDVLDEIFEAFRQIIPYDRIGCALLSDDGTKARALWSRSNYEGPDSLPEGYTEKLAGSSLQTILETGQPRIINDLQAYLEEHPASASTRLILESGIRSSLTCPLVADHQPVGFLFFSSREKHCYSHAHQRLFRQIAEQVSLTLGKSRLYQQVNALYEELLQAQLQLREKATHDHLTGIWNRGAIIEYLGKQIHQCDRSNDDLSVIMIDVDHFKSINDRFGHPVGDAVLKMVARGISSDLRGNDCVGRFGGEEFLVTCIGASGTAALGIAERICEVIGNMAFMFQGQPVSITISAGVACRDNQDREPLDSLLYRADEMLYQAKDQGRNTVCLDQRKTKDP